MNCETHASLELNSVKKNKHDCSFHQESIVFQTSVCSGLSLIFSVGAKPFELALSAQGSKGWVCNDVHTVQLNL